MNCKNALPIPVALCLGNRSCSGNCGNGSGGNGNCGGNCGGNGNGNHSCNHPSITLTDEISLDRSDIAASAKAVKKAVTKAEIELDMHIADTSHHAASFDAHNADANAHKVLLNPIKASLSEHDAEINAQALALTEHKNDLNAHGNTGGNVSCTGYIGEYKDFNRRSPFLGWAIRNGALLANAEVNHPELWAYLQEEDNAWLLKTEAEWQELIHANGMGGANAFVLDTVEKTIRLPDTRGDYIAGAGWNSKLVGDCDGDAIRNMAGSWPGFNSIGNISNKVLISSNGGYRRYHPMTNTHDSHTWGVNSFNASHVVPTDIRNHPATMYQLPCVYIGLPACPPEEEIVPTPEAELITA